MFDYLSMTSSSSFMNCQLRVARTPPDGIRARQQLSVTLMLAAPFGRQIRKILRERFLFDYSDTSHAVRYTTGKMLSGSPSQLNIEALQREHYSLPSRRLASFREFSIGFLLPYACIYKNIPLPIESVRMFVIVMQTPCTCNCRAEQRPIAQSASNKSHFHLWALSGF